MEQSLAIAQLTKWSDMVLSVCTSVPTLAAVVMGLHPERNERVKMLARIIPSTRFIILPSFKSNMTSTECLWY